MREADPWRGELATERGDEQNGQALGTIDDLVEELA